MYPIGLSCLCLFLASAGCNSLRQNANSPLALEYSVMGQYRILLTAKGGARVDLMYGPGRDAIGTILLPTSPQEVKRVVLVVEALIDSAPAGQRAFLPTLQATEKVSLRCWGYGGEKFVRGGEANPWQNHMWEGVVEEIGMISMLDLAQAVDSYETAERLVERNDPTGAVLKYTEALTSYFKWGGQRTNRYGTIWEPKEAFIFWTGGGERSRQEQYHLPEDVMKLPGMTADGAVRLLREMWTKITGPVIALSCSGESTTVSFAPGKEEGWGLVPGAIRPEALDLLRSDVPSPRYPADFRGRHTQFPLVFS